MQKSTAPSRSGGTTRSSALRMRTTSHHHKPPVILSFSAHDTVELGYADAARPQHTVALPPLPFTSPRNARDAQILFQRYAAPLSQAWSRLGVVAKGSSDTAPRRVVVLHPQGLYVNRYWKVAVCRILSNVLLLAASNPQAAVVSFVSTVQMVPWAVLSPQKQNDAVTLTVCLSACEVQCMVHACGHSLEYTYQSCAYSSSPAAGKQPNNTSRPQTVGDLRKRQEQLLLGAPSPIVTAVGQTLVQCPVPLRRAAAHNLVVAGTVVVPDFGRRLARQLHSFFLRDDDNDDEAKQDSKSSSDIDAGVVWTEVPLPKQRLRPLAEHICLVETTAVAPDALPWLGTSLWAWRQQQQQQPQESTQSSSSLHPQCWQPLVHETEW